MLTADVVKKVSAATAMAPRIVIVASTDLVLAALANIVAIVANTDLGAAASAA